jgi:membrane protein
VSGYRAGGPTINTPPSKQVPRAHPDSDKWWSRARLEATFAGRCATSFLEMQGIDRAMSISAQAFTSLVPLMLLTSALSRGGSNGAGAALVHRFHLTGESARVAEEVFARPGGSSVGALSVVLLLFSGISFTRRVQRMYLVVWRVPPRAGVGGSINAAFGLAALLLEVGLLSSLSSLIRHLPQGNLLTYPLSILASLVLWTSVPWLLLDRRVHWRRLLPGGALTAVCAAVYSVATSLYMPRLIESYSSRYGLFGVTLSLIGWLLATALIIVSATVVAAEFDRAPEPWAQRLRARLLKGADA